MNIFFIRHAERDPGTNILNSDGRDRAQFYKTALPAIAKDYFRLPIGRILYRSPKNYTLRCQETMVL